MKQKIWEYIQKHHMLQEGNYVLCGCSGGADSVALLLLLAEFREQMDFSLEAVCVEHGIRGEESRRDADFVKDLCSSHNIACLVKHVDVPGYAKDHRLGTEEAARILRYEAFWTRAEELKKEGHKKICLALAHHMEDNAETMLFQMARGSGLSGLCGMPPVRVEHEVAVIRPLLAVSRGAIEAYLAKRQQSYCTDSTNADETFSRNRIRRQILPQLSAVNERAVEHMNRTAQQLSEIRDYMEEQIRKSEREVVTVCEDGCYIDMKGLKALHPAIQAGIVRNAVFAVTGQRKDIASVHVEDILELADKQSGKRLSLPYQAEVWTEYGKLCFSVKKPKKEEPAIFAQVTSKLLAEWKATGGIHEVILSEGKGTLFCSVEAWKGNIEEIEKKPYTKILDYDMIKNGFLVRSRAVGDYFVLDEQGRHKKLSNYLVDEKIPVSRRDEVLLLTREDMVVWMIGGRISADCKVTETTEYILKIEYDGGKTNGF